MNNIKQAILFVAGIVLLTTGGCSDMNSLHQPYLDRGETIYATKIDSFKVRPGNNRVQLDFHFSAPRIVKGVLYWNLRAKSVEIPFPKPSGKAFEYLIPEPMPQGDYTFELITYDEFGNPSLTTEMVGKVYGADYEEALSNRRVEVSTVTEEGIVKTYLKWGGVENSYGTRLKYTSKDGKEIEKEIPEQEKETILTDNMPGSFFSYSTAYKPTELAIDTFYAKYKQVQFPK